MASTADAPRESEQKKQQAMEDRIVWLESIGLTLQAIRQMVQAGHQNTVRLMLTRMNMLCAEVKSSDDTAPRQPQSRVPASPVHGEGEDSETD
jgi:hypothetical protein